MNKQCRIAVTRRCNFRCSYCCMNLPSIKESFTEIDGLRDLPDLSQYESFCVTGGEPLCNPDVWIVLYILKQFNKPVYLYTNGTLLTTEIVADLKDAGVTAINVGYHNNPLQRVFFQYGPNSLANWAKILPVRLFVQDSVVDANMMWYCGTTPNLELRIWQKDVCVTPPEDRFLLRDTY
jgi:hypothetical protein